MPAQSPLPSHKSVATLKAKILRPSLSSRFQCWFQPPVSVASWITAKSSNEGLGTNWDGEFVSLSCAEATLPGSTLTTHETTSDFSGVTERHAYRRQYDPTAQFSFYVDHDYNIIYFFEHWMSYIANEQYEDVLNPNFSYRVNFPNDYKADGLYIRKFEKDYNHGNKTLQYKNINAYPISINSMPVAYENSSILMCTVSFNYSRYVVMPTYRTSDNLGEDGLREWVA